MHEMSLAESALQIVEATAQREGARRVALVVLEIGRLAAVDPAALAFCFGAVSKGGVAEGARLEMAEVAGRGRCRQCTAETEMEERYDLCPQCDGPLEVIAGDRMRVREIEIEQGGE